MNFLRVVFFCKDTRLPYIIAYFTKQFQGNDFRKKVRETPDPTGPALRPWSGHFFLKKRRGAFLSRLVVTPPCRSWLSPLVVALTGSGKRRKILSGRT